MKTNINQFDEKYLNMITRDISNKFCFSKDTTSDELHLFKIHPSGDTKLIFTFSKNSSDGAIVNTPTYIKNNIQLNYKIITLKKITANLASKQSDIMLEINTINNSALKIFKSHSLKELHCVYTNNASQLTAFTKLIEDIQKEMVLLTPDELNDLDSILQSSQLPIPTP